MRKEGDWALAHRGSMHIIARRVQGRVAYNSADLELETINARVHSDLAWSSVLSGRLNHVDEKSANRRNGP
jgi:hypothetical protein